MANITPCLILIPVLLMVFLVIHNFVHNNALQQQNVQSKEFSVFFRIGLHLSEFPITFSEEY